MKKKKIILLNGPPRCGKDFAGGILWDILPDAQVNKFAAQLKVRTHALYLKFDRHGLAFLHDHYEDCKDMPHPDFEGATPREAYIAFSEQYVKPLHGEAQFGRWLLDQIQDTPYETHIITDSGFVPEAKVLIEAFDAENITLVRIHREGCGFSSDSRSYLELPVKTIDIVNAGDASFSDLLLEHIL